MPRFNLVALLGFFLSALASPFPPGDGQSDGSRSNGGPSYDSPLYAKTAAAYCTSSDFKYKLSQIEAPVQSHQAPGYGQTSWDLEIDDRPSGIKQTITGFGAAVTDATVINFNKLQPDVLDCLLSTLMTPVGANFGLMRHTIGASDLSPDAYTYDENGRSPDLLLDVFDLGSEGVAMAKLLAEMKKFNPNTTVLGSPWSAPGWMKMNQVLFGTTTHNNLADQYLDKTKPDYSQQFADYFVEYIKAYKALGVDVDAITIQNEPVNSDVGYPTMWVYDSESGNLIQNYVGPALKSAGLKTSVWAYDHNTDKPWYPQTVLDLAEDYVDTVAWHCYAQSPDWSVLSDFHEKNPDVQQYMTECWTPAPDISAASTNWYQPANFTIGPLQNWASGVIAWTLGTDAQAGPHLSTGGCATCFGLVTINDDGSYTLNVAYYLLAQFSKFMPKGSQVMAGTGSSSDPDAPGVQSVASLNPDGSRTVVIMNTQLKELMVRLSMKQGESWSGRVPSNSIVTWVLP